MKNQATENGGANIKNLLGVLGLCARAGGLICGTDRVCEAMRDEMPAKSPRLVIEASGNSENTHKRITDKCTYYNIGHEMISADGATLAAALGKSGELAVVGIVNAGFCRAVYKQLEALSGK